MAQISDVFVLYNPNSTGDSESLAKALVDDLNNKGRSAVVVATQHAGHAEELALSYARECERPLIVSSSGDGGYNEVVNGAMAGIVEGRTPVCAVLAAGNANDHRRTTKEHGLVDAIVSEDITNIDVLKASFGTKTRYAHSYIGLGLTPAVAIELNRNRLNRIKETLIVLKSIRDYQPFTVRVDGVETTYDSLIFANISQMAKVLTIAENAEIDDGRFEVVAFPYKNKARLISLLFKAMTTGIKGRSVTQFEFEACKKMPVQFDGEIEHLQSGDVVRVASAIRALPTIL